MEVERQVRIKNGMGLHVRPATSLSKLAQKYQSRVEIIKDGQTVDAKSCIELLTLAAVEGTMLTIRASGEDAQQALEDVFKLIDSGFGEK
jgi:phosphotransferase system HPr (HPr) family protein